MTRLPSEAFVHAELEYRAGFWRSDRFLGELEGRARRHRRLGHRRRHSAAAHVASATPAQLPAAAGSAEPAREAAILDLRGGRRQPNAA